MHWADNKLLSNKWTYITLAGAVGIWWYMGTASDTHKKTAQNAVNVSISKAQKQDVPIEIQLVGTVVARESVVIKSRIDSIITNVMFHDGDYVKEGQPLFTLDDRAIKANLIQLEAALAKEQAQLVNAKRQYERAQSLLQKNVVAQAQVDEAKATYQAQLAQVAAAKATQENAAVQLTYTNINAPISGRTGTINVTRGNNVKANDTQALVSINQISPIRVQFSIPQRYYTQVKAAMSQQEGLSVFAKHSESPATASGKLEYIENNIDLSNGTFVARANFPNEKETLWPGMFVNITLQLGIEKNAITIPAVGIQGDEGKHFVYKLGAGDPPKAVRTPVEVSVTTNELSIVTKGIAEGDEVITDGLLRLTDGSVVHVTDPATAKDAGQTPPDANSKEKKNGADK